MQDRLDLRVAVARGKAARALMRRARSAFRPHLYTSNVDQH